MSKSTEDLIRELETGGVLEGRKDLAPRPGKRPARSLRRQTSTSTFLLILAVILVAVIGSLPFGSFALYPFALFVTLLHESGHALAAVATGGTVDQIRLSADLSGVTLTSAGMEAVIAPAGYLGATLAGVGLLLTPLRYARVALAGLTLVPLAALFLFQPASLFTGVWCIVFALGLGLAAWQLSPRIAAFLQIFLGVEAGLNAFRDLMTLLFLSSSAPHLKTDATNMSNALFLPPTFWAVSWTVMSLALLAVALLVLIRRDLRLPRD